MLTFTEFEDKLREELTGKHCWPEDYFRKQQIPMRVYSKPHYRKGRTPERAAILLNRLLFPIRL
jgi:hypothetical protein